MPNLSRNPNSSRNTVYHGPAVTKLSSVQPTSVRWLWPDRLALGKLTLLAGDPGLGKSYLTLDLAARVSSGTPFPGSPGTPGSANEPHGGGGSYQSFRGANRIPHKVILLSAEDDPADTIRPRLDAAGADCDNILLMRGIQMANQERSVNLREDIKHLRHLVESLAGECRLIVIDPISAYLGDDEGHSNTKVRNMLAPLAKLAQDFGLAVLAVTHLNKGSGGGGGPTNAIYRTMGSLAFTAAARTVHLVARDPDDEASGGTGQRRLVLPIKNNLGHDRTGWAFSLTTHEFIDPAGGDPDDYPTGRRKETKITWDPHPTQESADALLARLGRTTPGGGGEVPSPAMDEAVMFLQEALSNGGQPINELLTKANALGISKATLKRARHKAGVAVTREGGRHGRWVWSLTHPTDPDPTQKAPDPVKEITPADGLLYGSKND